MMKNRVGQGNRVLAIEYISSVVCAIATHVVMCRLVQFRHCLDEMSVCECSALSWLFLYYSRLLVHMCSFAVQGLREGVVCTWQCGLLSEFFDLVYFVIIMF